MITAVKEEMRIVDLWTLSAQSPQNLCQFLFNLIPDLSILNNTAVSQSPATAAAGN